MGGCRCTFRKCTVSTLKFPGMHFFHFPIKDKERLEKWIKYTGYENIRGLHPSQAKNKVICALHFRDECFMNYKKDRLTPQAVPTLFRLRSGLVLDYAASDNPQPTSLTPTTEKHLIPPEGYKSFSVPDEYILNELSDIEILEDEESEISEPEAKQAKVEEEMLSQILGDSEPTPPFYSIDSCLDETEKSVISVACDMEQRNYYLEDSVVTVVNSQSFLDVAEIEIVSSDKDDDKIVEFKEPQEITSENLPYESPESYETKLDELRKKCKEQEHKAAIKLAGLEASLSTAQQNECNALVRAVRAEEYIKTLRAELDAVKVANIELMKINTKALTRSSNLLPGHISKTHLFNGIKKYLSASMTAVVRMEMFGGSERPWKPDEKRACVELLHLGEKVYQFLSEEWRLRLPPINTVKTWMIELANEDEEKL